LSLGRLAFLGHGQSRSISPENFDGAKGGGARAIEGTGAASARELGVGWKVSPSVDWAGQQVGGVAQALGVSAVNAVQGRRAPAIGLAVDEVYGCGGTILTQGGASSRRGPALLPYSKRGPPT
jgi:hypothetical protein